LKKNVIMYTGVNILQGKSIDLIAVEQQVQIILDVIKSDHMM